MNDSLSLQPAPLRQAETTPAQLSASTLHEVSTSRPPTPSGRKTGMVRQSRGDRSPQPAAHLHCRRNTGSSNPWGGTTLASGSRVVFGLLSGRRGEARCGPGCRCESRLSAVKVQVDGPSPSGKRWQSCPKATPRFPNRRSSCCKETEGYRTNLAADRAVYVVLRPGPDGTAPEPFLATVCPFEAQDYADDADSRVDAVPMPASVAAWVTAFVRRHHVDEPFRKRKRGPRSSPESFARPPRSQR